MTNKKIDFDDINRQLAKKAAAEGQPVQNRPAPPGEQYLSEHDIFDLARIFAEGSTQKEIAELLERNTGRKVSVPAVNKMLKGKRQMLSLAMEWVITCYPANVEWEGDAQHLRYFKLQEQPVKK